MGYSVTITIDGTDSYSMADVTSSIKDANTAPEREMDRLINFLSGLSSGAKHSGTVTVDVGVAGLLASSATVTSATPLAADTITVNGVVFTAVSGTASANQFDISSADDTVIAANIAAAINASITSGIMGVVKATSAAAVVTISSQVAGVIGNTITLATSNGTRLAPSASKLSGGAGGTSLAGPVSWTV